MMPANPTDFDTLMQAVRDGEESALNDLFDQYYLVVKRLVHRGLARELRPSRPWIGALFSTGDVVQEVFLSVLRDLDAFEGESEAQFVSFLAAVTKSRLVDAIRFHEAMRRDRRRVRETNERIDPIERTSNPLRSAVSAEEVAHFAAALATFPERERLLLRGRLEHKSKFEELAQSLAYPTADAARKAFHVAQATLAMKIADADDTRSSST